MDIVSIKIYEYSELEEKAKERAKKDLQDLLNIMSNEDIEENAKEYLKMYGLSLITDIRFSLGYSQGDGIAFYGSVDLKEYIEKQKIDVNNIIPDISVNIYKANSHYDHYNSMGVESDIDSYDISEDPEDIEIGYISQKTYDETKEILSGLDEDIKNISKRLEKQSYRIIEENEKEEHIIELCNINNWKFFKNGSDYIEDN